MNITSRGAVLCIYKISILVVPFYDQSTLRGGLNAVRNYSLLVPFHVPHHIPVSRELLRPAELTAANTERSMGLSLFNLAKIANYLTAH
jgi:hypothetical protein